ncbi:glycosyltransferase [Roseiflexus castenholzii]|uniref:glycosyltransferase n=1 Tax=Roseiflexus castenholzii TaxID=120962 RepID=UPI003C7DDEAA
MMTRLRQRLPALLRAVADLPRTVTAPRRSPPRIRFVYLHPGAATRYRVWHQVEQAQIAGLAADAVALHDSARLYDLSQVDLLIAYRLPLAPLTLPLVAAARLRRIPLAFDTDDLVWDEREREYNFLDRHHDPVTIARLLRAARGMRRLMRLSDALILSTPFLAALASADIRRPTFISPNVLSREQTALSCAAFEERQQRPSSESPVIGYFCGHAHVHDEDIATIGAALRATLDACPEAKLRFYGEVTLPPELTEAPINERIEQRPVVDWRDLPCHIAAVDINIAPLVDNPQRRGKSAVKYLEAAAVGVPTVAVRLEPYRDAIAEGVTGVLAAARDEWVSALIRLLRDPELRRRMGEAARADVLARFTTERQAERFARMIGAIGRSA